MATHTERHHDYLASSFDGSVWPALLAVAAMFGLAAVAWLTN